ncbi:MAG: helix-turn-helix domain-containing protein [Oscillospiraceae bacterium]|nr:helix-turn-helix domain-containing protein [Oscillospiraceae bacterium]
MAKKNATFLGRLLRVLRAENDEILYDMAKKLGMATSYLSMIETGIRTVPKNFLVRIQTAYSLEEHRYLALLKASENDAAAKRGLSHFFETLHEDDRSYVAFPEEYVSVDNSREWEGDNKNERFCSPYTDEKGSNQESRLEKTG